MISIAELKTLNIEMGDIKCKSSDFAKDVIDRSLLKHFNCFYANSFFNHKLDKFIKYLSSPIVSDALQIIYGEKTCYIQKSATLCKCFMFEYKEFYFCFMEVTGEKRGFWSFIEKNYFYKVYENDSFQEDGIVFSWQFADKYSQLGTFLEFVLMQLFHVLILQKDVGQLFQLSAANKVGLFSNIVEGSHDRKMGKDLRFCEEQIGFSLNEESLHSIWQLKGGNFYLSILERQILEKELTNCNRSV